MKNQIKKVLSLVLVAVMCLSTFAVSASAATTCEHTNKIFSSTTKATCTGYGYDSYKCADCNKDFVENIVKPLGHDLKQTGETVPASCWREEASVWECQREGCDEKEVRGELTGKHCEKFTDPTFTVVDGKLQGSMECKKCGFVHTTDCECGVVHPELVVTADHSHEVEDMKADLKSVKKPTCTEKGEITYKCKKCAYSVAVVIEETHQITKHEAVAHTCTKDGNIEYFTCDLCGKYFVDETKDGKTTRKEVTADEVVDPKAHDLKKGALVSAEDCTPGNVKYAVYTWECSKCDHKEDITETKLAHSFEYDDEHSYDSTCVKYGLHVLLCTKCGQNESTVVSPKNFLISLGKDGTIDAADEEEPDDVWATLSELTTNEEYIKLATQVDAVCGGYATYTYTLYAKCSVDGCDYCKNGTVTVDYGEKKEHVWVEADDSAPKAATCTEVGYKAKYVCSNCTDKDGNPTVDPNRDGSEIPAKDHTWSDDVLYCSVEKIAKKVCAVCETTRDLTEDEAKKFTAPEGESHVTIIYDVTEATCTEDGEKITYCAVCHHIDEPEVLPATGHSIDKVNDTPVVIPGSCVEKSMLVYECKNDCGHNEFVYGDYDKSAEGHMAAMKAANDVATKKVLRAATCTVKELAEYKCTQCNVTYTETGDYGHDVVDKTVAPDCTTETNGKTGKWCNDCEKWVGETTPVPFEHTLSTTKYPAQSPCRPVGTPAGELWGWAEFDYCTVCEAAEKAAKEAAEAELEEGEELVYDKSKMSIESVKLTVRVKGHENKDKTYEGYDSTCTALGVKSFTYCETCEDPAEIVKAALASKDYAWRGDKLQIAKKAHMYVDANANGKKDADEDLYKVEATADCDDFGFDLYYCANCSEAIVKNFDYENGHDWIDEDEDDILDFNLDDSITNTEYDCTKDGYKYYACATKGCDAHKVIEETRVPAHHVDKTGKDFAHKSYDEDTDTYYASCTVIDDTTECIHGHDVEVSHEYYAYVDDAVAPTCTEEGYLANICADCGDKEIVILKDLETVLKEEWADDVAAGNVKGEFPYENVHALMYVEEEEVWKYKVYDMKALEWNTEALGDLEYLVVKYEIEVVEDKCVEPTHTADGKLVYVCPCCDAEVEVVLDKLTGIAMDITADSAVKPGAAIVNGGLVEFTVALNAAELEASILKADFFYNADVLTFVGAEVEDIFNVTDEAGTLIIESNSVVGNPVVGDAGRVSIIVDASYTSNKLPVDVELNGNDIAFATLTFRVAADAEDYDVIYGLVSELANVEGEMLVDVNGDLLFEFFQIMTEYEALFELYEKYETEVDAFYEAEYDLEDAIQAKIDAEASGDADAIALAEKNLAVAETIYDAAYAEAKVFLTAYEAFEKKADKWEEENEDELDDLFDSDIMTAVCDYEIAKLGNINGDKAINTVDALAIRQMAFTNLDGTIDAGEYALADLEAEADEEGNYPMVEVNYLAEADINMDGVVGLDDYALLNQYLVGNITYEELVLTSQTVDAE